MTAPTCTTPTSAPKQLNFPSIPGYTVRADFTGGELSSDLGAVLLGAVDHRIGMIKRLTAAIADTRDSRYITHPMHDLLLQRVFQIASGYEDGNDANSLRLTRCSSWLQIKPRWILIILLLVEQRTPVWKMH